MLHSRPGSLPSVTLRGPPSCLIPEVRAGVDRLALDHDLVVQVRAGRAAGVPGPADHGAALDPVTRLDVRLREMAVHALDVLAMVEDDRDAVFLIGPGDRHDAASRSADGRAVLCADV